MRDPAAARQRRARCRGLCGLRGATSCAARCDERCTSDAALASSALGSREVEELGDEAREPLDLVADDAARPRACSGSALLARSSARSRNATWSCAPLSGLRISCASPAASVPSAASFSCCADAGRERALVGRVLPDGEETTRRRRPQARRARGELPADVADLAGRVRTALSRRRRGGVGRAGEHGLDQRGRPRRERAPADRVSTNEAPSTSSRA